MNNKVSFKETYRFIVQICLSLIIYSSIVCAQQITTQTVPPLADASVYFSMGGPNIYKNNYLYHYRVSLTTFEIYSNIIIEYIMPPNEMQKGAIIWARLLNFDDLNIYPTPTISLPNKFKWISATSFSFVSERMVYIVQNIDSKTPIVKIQPEK